MDFERLRRNWSNLGSKDPMWAVLTRRDGQGRWSEDEFYRTGVDSMAWFLSRCALHAIDVPKGAALDFGCGAGRLTFALAPHFESVTGVDISASMLAFARKRNTFGERVRFVENTAPDLHRFADGSFAVVLSALVLQHMRPEYSRRYVGEFLRLLRPDGLLFFQLATGEHAGARDTRAEGPGSADEAHMEIHCVDRSEVHDVISNHGGELLIEEPDDWAGTDWTSAHFAVRKQ